MHIVLRMPLGSLSLVWLMVCPFLINLTTFKNNKTAVLHVCPLCRCHPRRIALHDLPGFIVVSPSRASDQSMICVSSMEPSMELVRDPPLRHEQSRKTAARCSRNGQRTRNHLAAPVALGQAPTRGTSVRRCPPQARQSGANPRPHVSGAAVSSAP